VGRSGTCWWTWHGSATPSDLQIVVAYGVSIREVAAEVRENVIAAVERMTA
jgi:uncharacterized alkaline shock family protein YloU